jgi:putative aldouronate transport system substrate-binding protein
MEKDLDRLRQQDGKFYLLPGLHEEPWQDYTLAVRTDVLAQLGLAVPKSWDELRTVLAAMKAAHPDTFPLSDRFKGENLLKTAATGFGTSAGWEYANATWDANAKKYVGTGATPGLRQLVEYFHSLVKDGLLDPESFAQDDDSAIRKLANGRSFVISTNAQNIVNDYRPALAATNPSATIAKIPFPSGPAGDVISAVTRLENGLMISAKAADSPNFVALMQFIDWLWYSDAGEEFALWGVEGTTYTKGPDGKRALAGGLPSKLQLQQRHGFSGGVFAYGGTTELLQSMFSPEELGFQKIMAAKKLLPLPPPYPFTDDEREQATLWEAPLKDFTKQMTLKFILGQRDLGEWDAYVKELDAKGMGSYIALVNKAYERFAKEHG